MVVGAVVVLLVVIIAAATGGDDGSKSSDADRVTTTTVKQVTTTQASTQTSSAPATAAASSSTTTEKPTTTTSGIPTFSDGMYEVGTDIPAGLYRSVDDTTGYWQISKDASGTLDAIVANDNTTGPCYIEVKAGQYLELNGITIASADLVKPTSIASENVTDGTYLVGTDIAPGKYKGTVRGDSGYWQVSTSANGDLMSILANDNVSGQFYVEVAKGQYLKLSGLTVSLVR